MKHLVSASAIGLLLQACAASSPTAPAADVPTLSWNDVSQRPLPSPGLRIAYARRRSNSASCGCHRAKVRSRSSRSCTAAAGSRTSTMRTSRHSQRHSRRKGMRRGPWNTGASAIPAAAGPIRSWTWHAVFDFLKELARRHPLDLDRVAVVGHSGRRTDRVLARRAQQCPQVERALPGGAAAAEGCDRARRHHRPRDVPDRDRG